jgi:hypothetical protein
VDIAERSWRRANSRGRAIEMAALTACAMSCWREESLSVSRDRSSFTSALSAAVSAEIGAWECMGVHGGWAVWECMGLHGGWAEGVGSEGGAEGVPVLGREGKS